MKNMKSILKMKKVDDEEPKEKNRRSSTRELFKSFSNNKDKKKKKSKPKSKDPMPTRERAPPARLAAASAAAPTDEIASNNNELTQDHVDVLAHVLGITTNDQLKRFLALHPPAEIARIKKNLSDQSKRKSLKTNKESKTSNSNAPSTGFAKYNGGPQAFVGLDPSKWRLQTFRFDGKSKCEVTGELEEVRAPIKDGLLQFLTSPITYLAMMFQTNIVDFDPTKQKYTLLHRLGSYQYRPQDTTDLYDEDAEGIFTLLIWTYQELPPFPNNELPPKARDLYTDHMSYMGQSLGSPAVLPGRGMAIGDAPNLCVIKDVDPTDVYQGTVGDCWLLGAISSIAEFDGAVKHLFRKTKLLHKRPLPGPNMYTITLWDLETWKPVSYQIDERLPIKGDGSGKLLSCRLSGYGELWPALLEKAMAIHCGGWDAIHGGCCTHAWSIMTGCKEQYTIERNPKTGKFFCLTKYNPNTRKWEKHYNNPKEDPGYNLWKSTWPLDNKSGEITEDELFQRICAWDRTNYIMSAATTGSGAKSRDAGLVEDHAYSLIAAYDNVANTGIGLLNVRNPWGTGEIEDGDFDDDGPGWEQYPQIKRKLKPVFQDDGAFWVTKEEFFKFYQTIYLSASDMTRFVED